MELNHERHQTLQYKYIKDVEDIWKSNAYEH